LAADAIVVSRRFEFEEIAYCLYRLRRSVARQPAGPNSQRADQADDDNEEDDE
jgi:hypothetical protein